MNDKAVALLEQYDIEVTRVRKGRGAYLCDTREGVLVFKEFAGNESRLMLQERLLRHIQEQNQVKVDTLIPTKEGTLFVKDRDGIRYILKTYFEGRECNIYDREECIEAMKLLAKLHNSMVHLPVNVVEESADSDVQQGQAHPIVNTTLQEYEKHNKELIHIRSFLRKKGQKQAFERKLFSVMDEYITQAKQVTEGWQQYVSDLSIEEKADTYYHGDYQYHNIIYYDKDWYVVNFEKCQQGSQIKDVYLLLRKLLEKSDWSVTLGRELLEAYMQLRPISAYEYIDLYYRLAYPEKFWKIANFYFSSNKAWIPQRNMEKLEKLLEQEESKKIFLEQVFCPEAM